MGAAKENSQFLSLFKKAANVGQHPASGSDWRKFGSGGGEFLEQAQWKNDKFLLSGTARLGNGGRRVRIKRWVGSPFPEAQGGPQTLYSHSSPAEQARLRDSRIRHPTAEPN